MRTLMLAGWGVVAAATALLLWSAAGGVTPNPTADRVMGQPAFTAIGCNNGGISPTSLCEPRGIAVSPVDGRVYIADTANNRVLWFDNPLINDSVADGLIGQPGPIATGCNTGGVSAASLCEPTAVDLDGHGNLYIADRANSRILQYDAGGLDGTADLVFGQPDFTSAVCNNGGLSATSLCYPEGVSGDDYFGNVYIADTGNSRIIGHFLPLQRDLISDRLFGQPNYTSSGCNTGGISSTSLCDPRSLNFHGTQHLFVADAGNDRVILYDNPLANSIADVVLGQPGFTTSGCNNGGISAGTVCAPQGVAIDEDMNTYIADHGNRRVLQYDDPLVTDSIAESVYGQSGFEATACHGGGVSSSSLCTPFGVAVDYNGNLYLTEQGGSRALGFDRCPGDIDCDGVANASDNCMLAANGAQTNSDGNIFDQSPPYAVDDKTFPMSDVPGDACDADRDNDGLLNAAESVPPCPSASAPTNPILLDTDGDRFHDGAECNLGTDPASAASKPGTNPGSTAACGPASDVDGDRLIARIETCAYNTNPAVADSDGDASTNGARDGCEAASVNTDRVVNSGDQLLLAQETIRVLAGGTPLPSLDVNRDGNINSGDQLQMGFMILPSGQCP